MSFIQINRAGLGGTTYSAQQGDLHVYHYSAEAPWVVETYGEGNSRTKMAQWPQVSPSRILAANFEVTSFRGRRGPLAELTEWRDSRHTAVSLCLIHAAGGEGKTRLARQFANLSQGKAAGQWVVAWIRHRLDPEAALHDFRKIDVAGAGLLLIIDYADRWPTADLLTCIRQHAEIDGRPTRILLTARTAGSWWRSLALHAFGLAGENTLSIPLPLLFQSVLERREAFNDARVELATKLQLPQSPSRLGENVDQSRYARALDLYMLALIDVLPSTTADLEPRTDGPARYLLERERDYWRRYSPGDEGMLQRCGLLACVVGPLPYKLAADLLIESDLVDSRNDAHRLLETYSVFYPPTDPLSRMEPIYPDNVAEELIALCVPDGSFEHSESDPWFCDFVSGIIAGAFSEKILVGVSTKLIARLIEASRAWPHIRAFLLDAVAQYLPESLQLLGPKAFCDLISSGDLSRELASVFQAALLPEDPFVWKIANAHIANSLASATWASSEAGVIKLQLARASALACSESGMRAAGVEWAERGLQLAREMGDSFEISQALTVFATVLGRSGQIQAAIKVGQEAVSLLEGSVSKHTEVAELLAQALNGLANRLSESGQSARSLVVALRAVEQARKCVNLADGSIRSQMHLAVALSNLSNRLSTVGRLEAAVTAALEANDIVSVNRPLADQEFLPEHSLVLVNLANRLVETGDCERAIVVNTEAVENYRALAEVSEPAYSAPHAISLSNLANRYSAIGDSQAALRCAAEAMSVADRAMQLGAPLSLKDHGIVLNAYALRLFEAGRLDEAFESSARCVSLMRSLSASGASYPRITAVAILNYAEIADAVGETELASGLRIEAALAADVKDPSSTPVSGTGGVFG